MRIKKTVRRALYACELFFLIRYVPQKYLQILLHHAAQFTRFQDAALAPQRLSVAEEHEGRDGLDTVLHREALVLLNVYLPGVDRLMASPVCYKSKLSSLRRKSKRPIVSIPSSLRRGMMWSFTMIIFLKESLMFMSERDSWISFSLSGMDKADCT